MMKMNIMNMTHKKITKEYKPQNGDIILYKVNEKTLRIFVVINEEYFYLYEIPNPLYPFGQTWMDNHAKDFINDTLIR